MAGPTRAIQAPTLLTIVSDTTVLANNPPADVTRAVASAGVADEASRSDHKHDVPTAAAVTITDATNAEGSATSLARSDHTHAHGSLSGGSLHAVATPSVAGFESAADKTKLDGISAGAAALTAAAPVNVQKNPAVVGVAVTAARADHVHDIDTAVAGAITIGAAAAEGSGNNLARADHVHSLAAPAAPANVTKAAASAGVASGPARADHKHDITTAAAVTITDATNAEGNATSLARSNHTHAHGNLSGGALHALVNGSTAGFMSAADYNKLQNLHNFGFRIVVGSEGYGDNPSNCDFLDPGNGLAIRQAIAAAGDLGGAEVYVRPGTYALDVDTANILVPNNVVITGAGDRTVIVPDGTNGQVFFMDGESCAVRNLCIARPDTSEFGGTGGVITIGHHCLSGLVENVTFRMFCAKSTTGCFAAIYMPEDTGRNRVRITGCHFFCSTAAFDQADPRAPIVGRITTGTEALIVIDNNFFDSFDGTFPVTCVQLRGGTAHITNNRFYDFTDVAVSLDAKTSPMHGSLIANNIVRPSAGAKYPISINCNDEHGGDMRFLRIQGNHFESISGDAIDIVIQLITESAYTMKGCVISGNTVASANTGILINQQSSTIDRTLIDANWLRDCGTPINDLGSSTILGDNAT